MSSTLSDGTTTLTLRFWTRFQSAREKPTIVHPLASGGAAITMRRAQTRKVQIAFELDEESEAEACELMLSRHSILVINDPSRPTISMQFVTTGKITTELNQDNTVWVVAVEAHEVGV